MAYSVAWGTKIITIPRTDMPIVQASPEVRELTVTAFWTAIHDIQDDEAGIPFPAIMDHSPPQTISGITFARRVTVINGYTVTFENGNYAVNITGGNSNLGDVINRNDVGVNTANSAGLIYEPQGVTVASVGSGAIAAASFATGAIASGAFATDALSASAVASAAAEKIGTATLDLSNGVETGFTLRQALRLIAAVLLGKVSSATSTPKFRDVNDTKDRVTSTVDVEGNRVSVTLDAS